MSKKVLHEGDEGVSLIIRGPEAKPARRRKRSSPKGPSGRSPVHVLYGGAHLFKADTANKLGRIALASLAEYASNFFEFAAALGHPAAEKIAASGRDLESLEKFYRSAPENLKTEDHAAWLAAAIYDRTRKRLKAEPVEDFRIDFEDGYGFRPDDEEDGDAARAAVELASAMSKGTITPFSGIRIKSYSKETRERARRTLNIFMTALVDATEGKLPENFVITLPKVTDKKEVAGLARDLKKIEKQTGLSEGSIRIEIMIEHPLAIIDRDGRIALRSLVEAARGRCVAAHFGAYDYTAALGISASHQDLTHPACDHARQMMLAALSPMGVRLSDSVTVQLPVQLHKGKELAEWQAAQNRSAVHAGWRVHFANVRRSMAQGFYQSWDLHPNQLAARYAAVFSFFLEAAEPQAARLRSFMDRAAQATLTGNAFDDAATAMGIVNFFRMGISCGALTKDEVKRMIGVDSEELGGELFAGGPDRKRS
ncbi:MAG: phosphoenolpyruvate kinase [Chloracidobacterium sp.]|nr:phosphoenolpyruvate kinase [Chloracidobacterium sp.]